ncbi:hypothetical protein [Thalassospira xiamenensis]|nr:hypothetical protein [Thalassospira xiamenensis]
MMFCNREWRQRAGFRGFGRDQNGAVGALQIRMIRGRLTEKSR